MSVPEGDCDGVFVLLSLVAWLGETEPLQEGLMVVDAVPIDDGDILMLRVELELAPTLSA